MSSNYPPGVTGNEPQISGIYPPEQVISQCDELIDQATSYVEEAVSIADDQFNGLSTKDYNQILEIQENIAEIKDILAAYVPEEQW